MKTPYRSITGHLIYLDSDWLPEVCNHCVSYIGKKPPVIFIFKSSEEGSLMIRRRDLLINFLGDYLKQNVQLLNPKKYWDLSKENLVYVEPSENSYFTSNYRGVSYDTRRNKWIAQMYYNNVRVFFKRFDTELEAANEYNLHVMEVGAPKSWLNVIKLDIPN